MGPSIANASARGGPSSEPVPSIEEGEVINIKDEEDDDEGDEADEEEDEEEEYIHPLFRNLSPLVRLAQRHSVYHMQKKPELADEEEQCHYCQIRKFSIHDDYKLYIINKVDHSLLPADFKFIEKTVYHPDVDVVTAEFRAGCECTDDRQCKRVGCHCLQDMDLNEMDINGKISVYHSKGPSQECIKGRYMDSRYPIYECHDACTCGPNCSNRVVERGRKVPLQIVRTLDGRGWGVKTVYTIKKGQFVDKYIGEVITAEEANRRRSESQIAQRKDVYLFALDKFSDPESEDPRLRAAAYEVDGEFMSGPTRFINHSCDPNLRIFARVGDHVDKPIHDLAFFAIKDISAGEELTFDYVDGLSEEQDDSKDAKKRKDMTKCLCGAKGCRGYLW